MTQDDLIQQISILVHGMNEDIKRMLDIIDAALKEPPTAGAIKLNVAWMSQLGDKANYGIGDCAEACTAMVLLYLGKAITSVDQVSKAAGLPQGFTESAWWDAVKAATAFGVTLQHAQNQTLDNLTAELQAGKPVIVLVDYPSIPPSLKYDQKYNSGHFLVVVGADAQSITVHDPYWPDTLHGAYIAYPRAAFLKAWSTPGPGHMLVNQTLYVR